MVDRRCEFRGIGGFFQYINFACDPPFRILDPPLLKESLKTGYNFQTLRQKNHFSSWTLVAGFFPKFIFSITFVFQLNLKLLINLVINFDGIP